MIKIISKYYKGKERSHISTYMVYLLICVFVKDMSQSNSRKNKKKLTRVHKFKQ